MFKQKELSFQSVLRHLSMVFRLALRARDRDPHSCIAFRCLSRSSACSAGWRDPQTGSAFHKCYRKRCSYPYLSVDMTSTDFETHTRDDVRIPHHEKLNVPNNPIQ